MDYSMGDDKNFEDKPFNQGLSEEKFQENMDYIMNHPFSWSKDNIP